MRALKRSWSGRILAAGLVFAGAAPALFAVPALDRDEARFAQSTAQMLDTGDYVNPRFLEASRDKKPVGVNELQALSVKAVATVLGEDAVDGRVFAYRLPSLLAMMIAAAAAVWGARAFWDPLRATAAGALFACAFLPATEAFIAKTDAVLCAAVTLSMAALGHIYAQAQRREAGPPAMRLRTLFWAGQAAAILDKGPIGPMVAATALLALWAMDRRGRWMRELGWGWGLLLVVAVVGPWAAAITVSTDGGFWSRAVAGDLAPKLVGGQEGHAGPPGWHLMLSPLTLFPMAFALPAAAVAGWTRRAEPGVRFALAWLVPSWLLFEALPTKLVHYPLPLFAPLAWLGVAGLLGAGGGGAAPGPRVRWIGAGLSAAGALALSAAVAIAVARYGGGSMTAATGLALALLVAAGVAGGGLTLAGPPWRAMAAAGAFGVAAHAVLGGAVAPALRALWVSQAAVDLVARAGLDPRDGVTPGPVAVAGYAEPSLVFALGGGVSLGDAGQAADAVAAGRPALVEDRQAQAFRKALSQAGVAATAAGRVSGFDDAGGRAVALTLWRPARSGE